MDFRQITIDEDDVLHIGAGATWTEVLTAIDDRLPEFSRILRRFGSPQIRHLATIGGNLVNASPIADSLPLLYVLDAQLETTGPQGLRRIPVDKFYLGYKQLDLGPTELLAAVHVPLPRADEDLKLYKVSKRRDLDISTVTAGMWYRVENDSIVAARFAAGGVGPTVLRLPRAEAYVCGLPCSETTFHEAGRIARQEVRPITDVAPARSIDPNWWKICFAKHTSIDELTAMPSFGRSLPHDSARGHVTGEAHYVEDLPRRQDELCVDFVGAPCASGAITSVDLAAARQVPGIVAVLTHRDLPGKNRFGPILEDEPFLVEDEVHYLGQPVVVIAGVSREITRKARALVKFGVVPRSPLLTIDAAIAADSFLGPERRIVRGDVDRALAAAPYQRRGVFESNGQEQFYFESQASLALPEEQGQLRVICSTQNPSETQAVVAAALGLRLHEVVCQCKRMGGGFGGKETQSAIPAVMAALVAQTTRRPARIVLTKSDDMQLTGKRHAYKTWYRVGFDAQGRILAASFDFVSNGGAFADLSTSVMERTMLHVDNAYYLPAISIRGRIARTNLPPNTAFRGFGGPQSIVVIENVMQEMAQTLGIDALDVRRANVYRDGDASRQLTPYGQIVRDHVLEELFDTLAETSDYRRRMQLVEQHNAHAPTHLRGLAMTAVKFGISFTTRFLNQANALVNVYTDGSVQVSTGGTEMGQGLNTKIRQLVADQFGINPQYVLLMTTSTEKNHNTSPTAASAGTDLNGAAAIAACQQIKTRMAEFAAELFADAHAGRAKAPDQVRFASGEVFDQRIADPAHRLPFGRFCAWHAARGSISERGDSSPHRVWTSTARRDGETPSTISPPEWR